MTILRSEGAGETSSAGFYNNAVTRSLRFNGLHGGDNPVLARNFLAPAGTGKKWIFAFWIKPCAFGNDTAIITAGSNATNYSAITFAANGDLNATDALHIVAVASNSNQYALQTKALFRDSTNWQHICIAFDSTQTTERNRMAIFVNGKLFNTTTTAANHFEVFTDYPSADTVPTYFNANGLTHRIGVFNVVGDAGNLEGYLADMYFLDDQSIFTNSVADPTANSTFINNDKDTLVTFCEQSNGIAIPKAYTGATSTYGNNGFHLDFTANGVATTAEGTDANTNIGDDKSGNGHNFSVTDIEATDVMLDTPENNFATMLGGGLAEPTDDQSYSGAGTYSEGNLKLVGTSTWSNGSSNFGVTSGKWYAECRIGAKAGSGYIRFGMRTRPTRTYDEYFWLDNGTGQIDATTSPYSSRVGTYTGGDILQIALDLDNNALYFGKDNTWQNSATASEIAAGTTTNAFVASSTIIPTGDGHAYFFYCQPHSSTSNITWNFGQD